MVFAFGNRCIYIPVFCNEGKQTENSVSKCVAGFFGIEPNSVPICIFQNHLLAFDVAVAKYPCNCVCYSFVCEKTKAYCRKGDCICTRAGSGCMERHKCIYTFWDG